MRWAWAWRPSEMPGACEWNAFGVSGRGEHILLRQRRRYHGRQRRAVKRQASSRGSAGGLPSNHPEQLAGCSDSRSPPQFQQGRVGALGKSVFYQDPLILLMLPQSRRGDPAGMEKAPGVGLTRPHFKTLLGASSQVQLKNSLENTGPGPRACLLYTSDAADDPRVV